MSISSITNAAIARRADFFPFNAVPSGLGDIARVIAGPLHRVAPGAPLAPPVPPGPGGASVPPVAGGPPLPPGIGGQPAPDAITQRPSTGATDALQVIAAFIPTEVLTLYVACIAVLHRGQSVTGGEWAAFWAFLVATPLIVWLVFATKIKAAGKQIPVSWSQCPVWEMCAASIAYAAWAYALPNSPFSQFAGAGYYSSGLAGFIILVVSTFLGLLAPIFQRPLAS